MKKNLIFSLRSKIVFYIIIPFLTVIILSGILQVFGIPFTNVKGSYGDKKSAIFNNLNSVADLKKNKLSNWINERIYDIKFIANSSTLKKSLSPGTSQPPAATKADSHRT